YRILAISVIAISVINIYELSITVGLILALALATPSTGFILDSIETSKISENQKYWVKLKAISAELVALGALLVLSQTKSIANISLSFLIIGLLIVVLPYLLRKLASTLELLAPGS